MVCAVRCPVRQTWYGTEVVSQHVDGGVGSHIGRECEVKPELRKSKWVGEDTDGSESLAPLEEVLSWGLEVWQADLLR